MRHPRRPAAWPGGGCRRARSARAREEGRCLDSANFDRDRANIDSADFVAAVEHLSSGKIRIEVKFGWRSTQPTERAEQSAVDDVRAGKIDLAVIPARVWDRLGVTSSLANRMLVGVERLGLVGIALIPGELRYPLGISRSLIGATDYVGATVECGRARAQSPPCTLLAPRPPPTTLGRSRDSMVPS